MINIKWHTLLLDEISDEINRGNAKHGHGPLATPIQVVAVLAEELGEFSQATMQGKHTEARKELIQVVAVAINYLTHNGPHFSDK
jgi:NTP pyrophosphatase (non-canonical NTP hydrolase)